MKQKNLAGITEWLNEVYQTPKEVKEFLEQLSSDTASRERIFLKELYLRYKFGMRGALPSALDSAAPHDIESFLVYSLYKYCGATPNGLNTKLANWVAEAVSIPADILAEIVCRTDTVDSRNELLMYTCYALVNGDDGVIEDSAYGVSIRSSAMQSFLAKLVVHKYGRVTEIETGELK